ncbi:MAG TPA: hypothetical protein VK820_05650 [Steroidobacteraceae bacterium]|jgi:hypothetical protein|nr:hypothetical protein [Steroidobacteraceae bacterium]
MAAILQTAVVIALVAASLILSGWWLTPARRRLWILDQLLPAEATRGPLVRLRRALLARSQIGCGACRANPNAAAPRSTEKGGGLRR